MAENLPDTNVGNIEYIRKQEAIDAFGLSEKTRKYGGDHSGYDTRMLYEIQDTIESLKPADVAPVAHGRWEHGKCNLCGEHAPYWCLATTYHESMYCPNCGAKMDGEENENG